jgi:tartrate/fumarate subfamily iron-sulfur-dependent hydro-lyase beta chain
VNVFRLKTPVSEADVRKLAIGDLVYLTGRKVYVLTMTPGAQRVLDAADKGHPIFDMDGSVVYHCPCGFEKLNGEYKVRYVGATTSMMNEPVTPKLIELGARIIMGKGGMGKATLNAMQMYGAAYAATVGASSSFLARGAKRVVRMIDPGIWLCELELEHFGPVIVGMDAHGHDLFDEVLKKARENVVQMTSPIAQDDQTD